MSTLEMTIEMAIKKIQQFSPEQRNKVIEYIEFLEFQAYQQQEKQPKTTLERNQDGIEVVQIQQQPPFNPRSFFGVAHQPKQVIDDYLTTAREGWL